MSPIVRILLAVGLLAGGGTAYAVLFAKPAENVIRGDDVAQTMSWQSSQQCKQCHQDVWDEWYGTHHQISYLNPEVRAQSDDFRNKECQACHLSQPVSITGFAERTLPRQTRPTEGIGCITCHLGHGGNIRCDHWCFSIKSFHNGNSEAFEIGNISKSNCSTYSFLQFR